MGYEICGKCYFWVEKSKNTLVNKVGQCRANPPQVIYDVHNIKGECNVWPMTRDTDWCGSYTMIKGDDGGDEPEE